MSDNPHGREPTGRFAKGTSGNPGGRPALPEWFRARGNDALQKLADVMDGKVEDPKVSPAQAALEVIERVYGKAPQSMDVNANELTAAAQALLRLATRKEGDSK